MIARSVFVALTAIAMCICITGRAAALTSDEQMCLSADKANDAHALDNHCPIAAAQQMDLTRSSSDPVEAQQAELREGGYLFMAAKGALLTMQFKLGAAEMFKARDVFKHVRDHGVTKDLRIKAMDGLKMVDDTMNRLMNLRT